jgi:transposase
MGSFFMSKRSRYSSEEKYEIMLLRQNGLKSKQEILSEYGVHSRTIQDWQYQYERYGIDGLSESKTQRRYSRELKLQIVQEVLSGQLSQRAAARKYEIPSKVTIGSWIKAYTESGELKYTPKGCARSMTKGRSTTWRERIDIVLYCLAHNRDFYHTAEAHNVSYQQIYQWVRKYDSGGENALKDNRGRTKSPDELTPEEKMKLENKKLQAENERLCAENAFLKKLEEFERRRS